jgi:hypothetical protein
MVTRKKAEHRTRRDRQQRQNEAFKAQTNSMVDAYMKWKVDVPCLEDAAPVSAPNGVGGHTVFLFDNFRMYILLLSFTFI